MSHHNQQRKDALKKWKADQIAETITAMPMSPEQLHLLLNFLNGQLKACDHTTKLTAIFLHVEKLDKQAVLSWLADHGGYCDCEVLANLDDLDRELRPPPQTNYHVLIPKKKNQARDLRTANGWNLSKLPEPWRVGNMNKPEDPIQLQIGKKGGCPVLIIEKAMEAGDPATDEYWSKLWYARTKLPNRGPLRISHTSLELPADLRSTVVQAPNWLPVVGWIIPTKGLWHLEFRTESTRAEGDFAQIAALLNALNTER